METTSRLPAIYYILKPNSQFERLSLAIGSVPRFDHLVDREALNPSPMSS